MDSFIPVFSKIYKIISQGNESVSLSYISQLENESHSNLLNESLGKDKMFQYTTTGPHKDDIIFFLNDKPIKKVWKSRAAKNISYCIKACTI